MRGTPSRQPKRGRSDVRATLGQNRAHGPTSADRAQIVTHLRDLTLRAFARMVGVVGTEPDGRYQLRGGITMRKEWRNLMSERSGPCVEGHQHTDAARFQYNNALQKVWVCLSCGKEFATMADLERDSY